MEQCKVDNLFDLKETIAADLLREVTYPWEALKAIGDFIRRKGKELNEDVFEKRGEDIWVAKSAKVAPIVGKGSVVGNSTELKNVILFNSVQVPHYNYVGDSVLGYKSHMGAGSITSNVKSDKTLVVVKGDEGQIETGLKKFGAMLGDYVEVGCNSVLNPGTVVGRHTNIYPLSMVRGVVSANSIYKNKNEVAAKEEQ